MKDPRPVSSFKIPGYTGNIDLFSRPKFYQKDGSLSTINSMSVNIDGKEVLIPTIGIRNGVPAQLSEKEAIDIYRATGKHLGKFSTPEEATKMAEFLHQQQQKYYSTKPRIKRIGK